MTDHEARIAYLEKQLLVLKKRIGKLEEYIDNLRWIIRALRG